MIRLLIADDHRLFGQGLMLSMHSEEALVLAALSELSLSEKTVSTHKVNHVPAPRRAEAGGPEALQT